MSNLVLQLITQLTFNNENDKVDLDYYFADSSVIQKWKGDKSTERKIFC